MNRDIDRDDGARPLFALPPGEVIARFSTDPRGREDHDSAYRRGVHQMAALDGLARPRPGRSHPGGAGPSAGGPRGGPEDGTIRRLSRGGGHGPQAGSRGS
jgi:hypothetical protein